MQRRNFITLTTVAMAAVGITGIGCGENHPAYEALLDKPEILSQICDLNTIKAIGKNYREQWAPHSDREELVNLLITDSSHNASPMPDRHYVNSIMRKNIEKDFETGNIVVVNGWVLSITEARQCALLSINNP